MSNLNSFGSAQSLTQLMSVGAKFGQIAYNKMKLKVQCVKFSLNYYMILEEALDTVHRYMKKSGLTENNNVSATFQL